MLPPLVNDRFDTAWDLMIATQGTYCSKFTSHLGGLRKYDENAHIVTPVAPLTSRMTSAASLRNRQGGMKQKPARTWDAPPTETKTSPYGVKTGGGLPRCVGFLHFCPRVSTNVLVMGATGLRPQWQHFRTRRSSRREADTNKMPAMDQSSELVYGQRPFSWKALYAQHIFWGRRLVPTSVDSQRGIGGEHVGTHPWPASQGLPTFQAP